MTALNPFEGEFYREALQVSRSTREMFCLIEGRHVHPSTLYPGGVGTVPSVQLFTDYLVRLMKYVEYMKKVVPLHDDLFDFFYEALPGYEEVGRRRVLLGCWGAFNDPDVCDDRYETMTDWGRKMFVTPGVIVDGKLVTTNLVDINVNMRILLGSWFYDGWENAETFVTEDALGNRIDQNHPWNQTTFPTPQKRDLEGKYTWVVSPRWYHEAEKGDNKHLALDTGGGALARLWTTALAGKVGVGYVKSTGNSVKITLPKTMSKPETEFEWKIPKLSNAIERNRARTYFQAYTASMALHFVEKALTEVHADLIDELACDKQIEKILLLHGLHPKSSEMRVREVLENLDPFLKLNKISAEVTEFDDELVKITLQVSKNDSAKSLQKIIENAIFDRAPDIPSLQIEVVGPQNFVQIQRIK